MWPAAGTSWKQVASCWKTTRERYSRTKRSRRLTWGSSNCRFAGKDRTERDQRLLPAGNVSSRRETSPPEGNFSSRRGTSPPEGKPPPEGNVSSRRERLL